MQKNIRKNENPQATTRQLWGSNFDFPKQLEPEPKNAVAYKKKIYTMSAEELKALLN